MTSPSADAATSVHISPSFAARSSRRSSLSRRFDGSERIHRRANSARLAPTVRPTSSADVKEDVSPPDTSSSDANVASDVASGVASDTSSSSPPSPSAFAPVSSNHHSGVPGVIGLPNSRLSKFSMNVRRLPRLFSNQNASCP